MSSLADSIFLPPLGVWNARLVICAKGHALHRTGRFTFDRTGTKDVGAISLDPCGVLDLQVMDTAGAPIEEFDLFFNGEVVYKYQRQPLPGGGFRCDDLPLGRVDTEVSAEGYVPASESTTLDPGRPGELRVVLMRKE